MFANSRFKCFVYTNELLIGAGRALADGIDCAYIADVAVHPDHQRQGLGKAIIRRLVQLSTDHKKIILYANPGTEPFYVVEHRQAGEITARARELRARRTLLERAHGIANRFGRLAGAPA